MNTHLDDIATAGRTLRSQSPEDWPLTVAGLAERLERELDGSTTLEAVVREIIQIALRLRCDTVAGASALGARIARASVAPTGTRTDTFRNAVRSPNWRARPRSSMAWGWSTLVLERRDDVLERRSDDSEQLPDGLRVAGEVDD